MANPLPRLRMDLEFLPSPLEDRPGLFIRDPYRYTDAAVIVPPLLVEGLEFFNGEQSELDLQAHLVRLTGELIPREAVQQFVQSMEQNGLLQTEGFDQRKEAKHREFREAPRRTPIHAGAAYPEADAALRERLDQFAADGAGAADPHPRLVALSRGA